MVLAGCGVSKTIDPVAAAATKSENAGGAKMDMTVAASADGKSFTVTAGGVFDQSEGDMTMDLSDVVSQAGLPASDGTAEFRYLQENGDPVVYMSIPFLSSQLPGGASWIKIDLEQAGKSLGVDLDQLINQANQNPAQALDMLRASGSVTEVGTETVDGVSTTHYKATIDLSQAADKLGSDAEAWVQRLVNAGAPATIPVDVWIGDDGLIRRLTMDESLATGAQSGDVKVTIDISDYGTPVNVTAPPASDTIDLTALASQAAAAAKG